MKRVLLLSGAALVLLLGVCAAAVVYGTSTPTPAPDTATTTAPALPTETSLPLQDEETVLSVHDGDTFTLQDKRVVRLLGINAPEVPPTSNPAQCYGPQATTAVKNVLQPGTVVHLYTDPKQGPTDKYNRLLRYVEVPSLEIEDLSAYLLEAGAAQVYERYPVARTPTYLQLQQQAQAHKQGLWGIC